jgi:hypothetical protein
MLSIADDVPVPDVMEGWTATLESDLDATALFDLARDPIVYRVFVLPDLLEIDLSFVPASGFAPSGPDVRVLFGEAGAPPAEPPTDVEELLGYAVHHALHARIAIERGRVWQAEFWISAVRDYALAIECHHLGLDGGYGRDFDRVPDAVKDRASSAIVASLTRTELLRSLGGAIDALAAAAVEMPLWRRVEPQLMRVVDADLTAQIEPTITGRSAT